MAVRAAAKYILSQRQEIAQAVVDRQYNRQPELPERYGESGRSKCIQDTDYHLAHLASSLMFSSQLLFTNYICWVKTVLTVRHIHPQDVEINLVCLWEVLLERLPTGCVSAVQPYLEAALRIQPQEPSDLPTLLASDTPLTALAQQYLRALLRAERHEAIRLVREAFEAGVTITDLYLQVFQRTQREIGRLWQLNQLTVAQEHYCTAATQLVMAQLYPYLFSLPKNGRRLIATSVGGEYHEVGLRIVTDLFEANGWNTIYLGANLPAQSLMQSLEQHQPDLLVISVTMAYHLPAVEELIALVRSVKGHPSLKIMVGGYPFNMDADLWRRVGADAYATDASEALQTANQLLDSPLMSVDMGRNIVPVIHADPIAPRDVATANEAVSQFDEMSRLNSDLITLQRTLVQKNAELEREMRERKRLEEQVRQVQKMEAIGQLAGGMAHSLNNLMTTVLGYSEIMLGSMTQEDTLFSCVLEIKRASSRTATLTQRLLAFSRQQLLSIRVVDINAVLGSLEPTIRAMLGRVHFDLILDPSLAATKADHVQLEEAVLTLARNALEAMPEGGRLKVQTSNVELGGEYVLMHPEIRPGAYVQLVVSDTGTGMDEEALGHMFEPFYSPGEVSAGSGLGLAAVYGFVKQCGGDIAVESIPKKGTTFRIYLPINDMV